MSLPARRYWTVDEYHHMADSGLISPDDRTELLDGEVIRMAPIGSRHNACVVRLTRWLVTSLADRAVVNPQGSMLLSHFSEPQPDIAVFRPKDDDYASGLAEPGDVLMLVEVADSSASFDRNRKAPLYLQAGIPEVWVVDLSGGVIEVFIGETVRIVRTGDTLSPQAFPDLVVDVAHLLLA